MKKKTGDRVVLREQAKASQLISASIIIIIIILMLKGLRRKIIKKRFS